MSDAFFTQVEGRIPFGGLDATDPLSFKVYDPDRLVLGKRMADHLRIGVCVWHTFAWAGTDMFGAGTLDRPWLAPGRDPMDAAREKMAAAFEFLVQARCALLLLPRPRRGTHRPHLRRVTRQPRRARRRRRWVPGADGGAAPLGDREPVHPPAIRGRGRHEPRPGGLRLRARRRSGRCWRSPSDWVAPTTYCGAAARDTTPCSTRTSRREGDQLARFLHLVAEHKHKIGFQGTLLIEPKPMEPTKHQYDHDTATVHGFLVRNGLEREYKVNIEANHATLAGYSFHHEVAYAVAHGILGSIDANRGDPQNGWDTDQFPNSVEDLAMPLYEILQGWRPQHGWLQLRREAASPEHRPERPVPCPHRRHRHARPGPARRSRHDRGGHAGVHGGGPLRRLVRSARDVDPCG